MKIEHAVGKACIALMALTLSTAALAQAGARTNPADASVPVPAVKPESTFSGYQPFREQPVRSWKDANQEVADNPGMGSMPGMSGMGGHNMSGMDSKGAAAGHDMSSMPGMPGMGSKPGASKPQAGAAGHDMSSMPGMPGMGSKAGAAPKAKTAAAAGHDIGSMQGMPGMASKAGSAPKVQASAGGHDMSSMPGMVSKAGSAAKPHADDGHAHNAGSMQGMPGTASKSGSTPKTPAGGEPGHDMASMQKMPGMASKAGNSPSGPLTGTGVVRAVDKASGKVRLTHDPIEAMGWPKMTLFFRLKDNALADRVKDGDTVEFSLEKAASGYVISDLQKSSAVRATKPAK